MTPPTLTTTMPTSTVHHVTIGELELAFVVRVWWMSGEPGGWTWTARAEDHDERLTGLQCGQGLWATPTAALEMAVAALERRFA